MYNKLIMTSGFNIEGYQIIEYIGFYTGECVLGTGFLSNFEASFADFLGKNSVLYEDKLESTKEAAMESLKRKVERTEANAIIGLDIDYTMFASNMIGVIVNGTAVRIEPIKNTNERPAYAFHYPVSNYYPDFCFRTYAINCLRKTSGEAMIQIEIANYKPNQIDAINADIFLYTIFGDQITLNDISFTNIHQSKKPKKYLTEFVDVPIKSSNFKILERAYININKYIVNSKLFKMDEKSFGIPLTKERHYELVNTYGDDAICPYTELISEWICVCGTHNDKELNICKLCGRKKDRIGIDKRKMLHNIYVKANTCNTAKEIYNFLIEISQELRIIPQTVMQVMKENSGYEKLYGNMKNSSIAALKEYINDQLNE